MRRVVWLVSVVAACGEDVGSGPNVPILTAPSAFKDAQCEHLVRCGEFPDKTTCARYAFVSNLDLEPTPQIVAAVLAGKIAYSGASFAACVAAIASATCDRTDQDSRGVPAACNQVFRGAVTGGGACAIDAECISDVCNLACGSASTCCTGTCLGSTPPAPTPLAPIGASCATKGCVDGSFCSSIDQLCTALRTANMPCSSASQCAYGLSCFGSMMLTCQPLPALGQPCPNGLCRDEGQHCKLPATGGTAVCTADGLPGADCGFNTDCSPYYRCDTTMKCAQLPALGESCSGTGACANSESVFCDSGTVLCTARQPAGATCTSSQQCASNACSPATNTCVMPESCI